MQQYDQPPTEILLPALRDGRLERRQDRDRAESPTYYDVPTIKRPTWTWYIPLYFFIGGVASGVSFIGALAELFGGKDHRSTVRNARYLSVILAALCPIPLILDLGRPWRFFRMLRIVKFSSPLNLGTWILSGFGALSAFLVARQAAEDNFIVKRKSTLGRLATLPPSGPITVLHGLFGMALGGYTGTLLAATVVPLWASAGVLLGPLFLAASATSGAAALVLTGILTGRQSREARRDIQVIANVASAVQLGLATAHETFTPERINRPLRTGLWGRLFRYGAVGGGLFLPMGLRFLARISGRRMEPAISATAAVCTLLGTLAERFAIVEAGKLSAVDPVAYNELTQGPRHKARPAPVRQASTAATFSPAREHVAASDT
ncbi:MAG: NrfD/PsrC family molybdoenzyme membrane anchor subunit [Ktedonobacterales bacterium]